MIGRDLLPSHFCFVYYRPFSWCRWRIFLAKTIRKDWLLPCTNRIPAERKRCTESWHCYTFCWIWEGKLLTSASKGAAYSRNDKSELCSTPIYFYLLEHMQKCNYISWAWTVNGDHKILSICHYNTCQLVTALLGRGSKCCCLHDSSVEGHDLLAWFTEHNWVCLEIVQFRQQCLKVEIIYTTTKFLI